MRMLTNLMVSLGMAAIMAGMAHGEPQRVHGDVPGLFERVAIHPGGVLHDAPGGDVSSAPDAFSVLYIFDTQQRGGETWLHVGPSAERDATGWLRAEEATELRHMLVLSPQTRQNRERALFFETREDVQAIATSRSRVNDYLGLLDEIDAGNTPSGVVGIQPENQPSIADAFSFMPIRTAEEVFVAGLGNRRLFETLSIPLPPEAADDGDFRTGVVFVVDTTSSMGPYIQGVRDMMRQVSEDLTEAADGTPISFGIVAYRDDVSLRPALEYTTKVAFPLELQYDAAGFDRAISQLEEASVSSPDFQEDAVAGLNAALELPGWEDFTKRVVILVTDAPTRGGDPDDASSTALTLGGIQLKAQDKRITLSSLFLATAAGSEHHAVGRQQYRSVSIWQNGNSAMFEIDNGEIDVFGSDISRLVRGVADILGEDAPDCASPGGLSDVDRVLCEIEDRTAAVRLEWLGRQQGVPAPAISAAWVADVSLDSNRARDQTMAYKPYLLLTRDQLNDLVLVLDELVSIASNDIDRNREEVLRIFQGALSRGAVTQDLQNAAATSGNAPLITDYSNMSDFLPAFLSELPLTSPFMNLEVGSWINPSEQAAHMFEVRSKIEEYRDYLDDNDRWIALSDGAQTGDLVYPIPWDRIP